GRCAQISARCVTKCAQENSSTWHHPLAVACAVGGALAFKRTCTAKLVPVRVISCLTAGLRGVTHELTHVRTAHFRLRPSRPRCTWPVAGGPDQCALPAREPATLATGRFARSE